MREGRGTGGEQPPPPLETRFARGTRPRTPADTAPFLLPCGAGAPAAIPPRLPASECTRTPIRLLKPRRNTPPFPPPRFAKAARPRAPPRAPGFRARNRRASSTADPFYIFGAPPAPRRSPIRAPCCGGRTFRRRPRTRPPASRGPFCALNPTRAPSPASGLAPPTPRTQLVPPPPPLCQQPNLWPGQGPLTRSGGRVRGAWPHASMVARPPPPTLLTAPPR